MNYPGLATAKLNTAGAYVSIQGRYLFALGIEPHHGRIPVVRLGGHREKDETGWQCAVREIREEASLSLRPLRPRLTYLFHAEQPEDGPSALGGWPERKHEPSPFVVVAYVREDESILSLMYLSQADGNPLPSCEVRGLVLLTESEIQDLCRKPTTLRTFLEQGGQVILNGEFDLDRILEPFIQLRLLSGLLRTQRVLSAT